MKIFFNFYKSYESIFIKLFFNLKFIDWNWLYSKNLDEIMPIGIESKTKLIKIQIHVQIFPGIVTGTTSPIINIKN